MQATIKLLSFCLLGAVLLFGAGCFAAETLQAAGMTEDALLQVDSQVQDLQDAQEGTTNKLQGLENDLREDGLDDYANTAGECRSELQEQRTKVGTIRDGVIEALNSNADAQDSAELGAGAEQLADVATGGAYSVGKGLLAGVAGLVSIWGANKYRKYRKTRKARRRVDVTPPTPTEPEDTKEPTPTEGEDESTT